MVNISQMTISSAFCWIVWGVKWTFILHLPISVIRISDIGKSFSDIGKSSHFPISEIRITDIWNSNFRYLKIEFPISENHLDLPISEIRISDIGKSFWFSDTGKSVDFPISVIQNDFRISVNQSIYRYRKFEFPISENRPNIPNR